MPLSGWIMSKADGYTTSFFGIPFPLPGIEINKLIAKFFLQSHLQSHYYFFWNVGVLMVLHILGNLKHWFINKDGVVQKIWNFNKESRGA